VKQVVTSPARNVDKLIDRSAFQEYFMRPTDLQRYKNLLLEKQREFVSAKFDARGLVPCAGGWAGDSIDQANASAEAELRILLHQTDGPLLRAIEEALARVRRGTYGVCDRCKQPISKARLEVVPWTRHCRECKDREHADA